MAPTTATRTAGIVRVTRGSTSSTASVARPTVRAVASRWSKFVTNSRISSTKVSASVENPLSFGSCPTMMTIGQPVHVADLHLARQQVGDEAELADAEPDLDEADQDGEHAGQGDGGGGVVAGHDERGDGGEDQRPE